MDACDEMANGFRFFFTEDKMNEGYIITELLCKES
jgi:hypothetical protein